MKLMRPRARPVRWRCGRCTGTVRAGSGFRIEPPLLDLLAVEDMGRRRRAGAAIRLLLESRDSRGEP